MTQLIDDVLGVRALLADPAVWCKNTLFAAATGEPLEMTSATSVPDGVVRMCLLGAQIKHGIFDDCSGARGVQFAKAFVHANGLVNYEDDPTLIFASNTMVQYNNRKRTTHAHLLEALDKTVAYAEAKGL